MSISNKINIAVIGATGYTGRSYLYAFKAFESKYKEFMRYKKSRKKDIFF